MTRPRANDLPSPDRVRSELARTARNAALLVQAAQRLVVAYEEAYEAGLSKGRRGDVIGGRGAGFDDTDPTADIVASWDHRRIRGAVGFVGRRVRRALRSLDEAEDALMDAFLDIDPDLKADRARRRAEARALVQEVEGEQSA